MNDIFVTYPGGKNGSGVYQKIINQMPPHRVYVEAFLGGGAIMRAKRPAMVNVGIDADRAVVMEWKVKPPAEVPNLTVLQEDAIVWLQDNFARLGPDCLVYADPPYLMSTRSSQRQFYAVEMAEEKEHRMLIGVLRGLKCMVMLSGYWSQLYAEMLHDWRTYTFQAMTRGGTVAQEWVWMNFPAPVELHDYRYLGETFREREYIKRMRVRWLAKLEKMTPLKRQALLMAISELRSGSGVPGGVVEEGDVDMSASVDGAVGAESGGYDDGCAPGEIRMGPGGLEYNLAIEDAVAVDEELRACIGGNGVGGPTRVGGGE
jgi:DNA adenine methylase